MAVLAAAGILPAVAAFLADRAATRSTDLDVEKVADRLADLVRDQWDREATRRGVGRPPLDVLWQPADVDLVHSWQELTAQATVGRSGPAPAIPAGEPGDLAGHGALIASYDRSPCGRLVVLGEPGAGKTVLLVRLVLDLLARRTTGEPVPLLVPMASWDPDGRSLYAWLEAQILREYPHLSATDAATGRRRAGALLDAGLILPVLDGLDEIRAGCRDQALAAINDGLRSTTGLVLSCRTDEFRAAVHPSPGRRPVHVEGAAAVALTRLTPAAVGAYLLAGAGSGPGGPARWAPVLAALADPGSAVSRALVTPLAASLATTIYNPRPRESAFDLPHPVDLCSLPTPEAVEQHLLAGFVAGAYRPHPDRPTRWNADQATRYLTFLARHLEHRLHTTGLAWWELPAATPRPYLSLALGLVNGLVVGMVAGIAAGIAISPVVGLASGGVAGAAAAIAAGLVGWRGNARPSRITLRPLRREDLVIVAVAGLFGGLVHGTMFGIIKGPVVGLLGGVAVGLVGGLGIVLTARPFFDSDPDVHAAPGPYQLLVDDRNSGLVGGVVLGCVSAVANGLVSAVLGGLGPVSTLVFVGGFATGLGACLVGGAGESWGWAWSRLAVARFWLAARREQPLCLVTFLAQAHDRGVLRQAGGVWEFRHASLQRHLANRS
ncbi:NACHT domain-containing protein [Parafrankia sp. FMc2]|uniref:NACHT domain-containing protein n=1 Tax=Parafrankia sp. FMc2 TaxID=3233196 RepID=UPI0034D75B67